MQKFLSFLILFGVLSHGGLAGDFGSITKIFNESCVQCHGKNGKTKGKVDLTKIKKISDFDRDRELLDTIVDVLDFNEMPPEDEPQLSIESKKRLVDALESIRARFAKKKSYNHAPMRRMNRFQYDNAVVDLFKLRGVVFSLPERMMREHQNYFKPETKKMGDVVTVGSRPLGKSQMIEKRLAGVAPFPQDLRAENGFDNRGDHLSLSPLLLEAFLRLGQSVVNSNDFNSSNVGIWNEFFKSPAAGQEVELVVKDRLEKFLSRAFRRIVTSDVLDRYSSFVIKKISEGASFQDAMKDVSAAVISSPMFLYHYDGFTDDKKNSDRVDSFELASRLSFFLWGSIPDKELLMLAASDDLLRADVLEAQVNRMLLDQKLKRFCDSFPSQWLQLERIISATPNRDLFPDFYFLKYRDSMHMMLEPLLVFETVLVENKSILQLIDSDFTYRSSLLQHAYKGLALGDFDGKSRNEVTVLRFHRMPVSDRRNGGVITNAAVMTMTSGTERTKPITRGSWLASVIFNNPPEPPPADAPPLDEHPPEEEKNMTLRERLSKHRERTDCRGCHEKIDPLGFALENFDAIGNWRTHYPNGREIDMAGTLFRTHHFADILEFKDALLAEKDRFAKAFAGHLLSFALARALGPGDQMALESIVKKTKPDGYKMKDFIIGVIMSDPFQMKSNPQMIEMN